MRLLIFLAILPSALLAIRVYTYDRIEKEPFRLLAKVFLFGMISCIPAAILESIGEVLIYRFTHNVRLISLLTYLVLVPVAEECAKYRALHTTWRRPEFNYTFDGIVYGVMAALGFATLENILYVVEYQELSTAIMRGIFSVPLHCTCGVFMGYYYGVARGQDARGSSAGSHRARRLAIVVPWLIHGFYDYSLDTESLTMLVAGLVFTLLIFAVASRQVRYASLHDEPIATSIDILAQPVPATRAPEGAWSNKGTPPPPFNR